MFQTRIAVKNWLTQRRILVLSLVVAVLASLGSFAVVESVLGDSHEGVFTEEYITVAEDGNWSGQIEPGEHQQWTFTLTEARDDQNISIRNMQPSDSMLNVSFDGQELGTLRAPGGSMILSLDAGDHSITLDNPSTSVTVTYDLYLGHALILSPPALMRVPVSGGVVESEIISVVSAEPGLFTDEPSSGSLVYSGGPPGSSGVISDDTIGSTDGTVTTVHTISVNVPEQDATGIFDYTLTGTLTACHNVPIDPNVFLGPVACSDPLITVVVTGQIEVLTDHTDIEADLAALEAKLDAIEAKLDAQAAAIAALVDELIDDDDSSDDGSSDD